MTQRASIILIHGASSSGKSTLSCAVQDRIEVPFWHISIDHLRDAGVLPLRRIASGAFAWKTMRQSFFDGFHKSLAAYASAGNNLIVEHILDTPGWQADLARLFVPFDVLFVGLHCPLDELRRREAARGDRSAGSAERDFSTIHQGRRYDLELQALDGCEVNAEKILALWRSERPPYSFFKVSAGR